MIFVSHNADVSPRRDLYLTTNNTHNRQTSMPPAGFEPTISVGERPQTYALDRAATGTGKLFRYKRIIIIIIIIIYLTANGLSAGGSGYIHKYELRI